MKYMNNHVKQQEILLDSESNTNDYRIEPFILNASNIADLSYLITSAFLHDGDIVNNGGGIVFNEETFNRVFNSPHADKDIFVRAIHIPTGKVVGFVGCLRRIIHYEGKLYKCAVPSWAAVHWEHQRNHLSVRMGMELATLLLKKKFDIAFAFLEPNQHGKDTSASVSKNSDKLNLMNLTTINKFLIRVFDVKALSTVIKLKSYEKLGITLLSPAKTKYKKNKNIRKFQPKDAEQLLSLMEDHISHNQMSIVHDPDDFFWYLKQPGINCVVFEKEPDEIEGFILAWEFQFAGFGNHIPFGWIDLVHLYRLSENDAADLCRYFAQTSKEMGWAGLQTPFIPYFNYKPFRKAKFILFPKKLNIDMFFKEGHSSLALPEKVTSLYFDWR